MRHIPALLALLVAVGGCGQIGPLVLPTDDDDQATEAVQPPAQEDISSSDGVERPERSD